LRLAVQEVEAVVVAVLVAVITMHPSTVLLALVVVVL
jgi:hypothetical protein